MSRWLEWRLRRAQDRLDDAEHDFRKWGFANRPSEDRAAERRIEKLRRKRDELRDRRAREALAEERS